MTSFLPTIAKQLGYSTFVVGIVYSILPILSLIAKPIVGAVVDQFQVKRTMFLVFIFLSGLSAFSLMYVPEIHLDTNAELDCNTETFLNVCPEDKLSLSSKCKGERVMEHKGDGFIPCEVNINFFYVYIFYN